MLKLLLGQKGLFQNHLNVLCSRIFTDGRSLHCCPQRPGGSGDTAQFPLLPSKSAAVVKADFPNRVLDGTACPYLMLRQGRRKAPISLGEGDPQTHPKITQNPSPFSLA